MGYEFYISLRYLRARRKQIFLSIITLISVSGVALGVAALIITLSVMNGFQTDLREKILGINAHVVLFSQKGISPEENKRIAGILGGYSDIVYSAPFTYTQIMIKSSSASQGVVLKGVLPEKTLEVTTLEKYLIAGSWDDLYGAETRNIVLGKEIARNLSVWLDDEVFLILPDTKIGAIPKIERFRVKGIFESGMYDYDNSLSYVNLELSRKLFSGVGGFELKVDRIYAARNIAEEISEKIKGPYVVRSWDQMHRNLFAALKLEKTLMFIILTLIIFVASFNIISLLMLMTMEKTRDIGILKAIGATDGSISRIFFFQGGIIGLLGTFSGAVIAFLICYLLKRYSFIELPADVYYLSTLPVELKSMDIFLVCICAVCISLLASFYPASRAAKLDPCQAIRYE